LTHAPHDYARRGCVHGLSGCLNDDGDIALTDPAIIVANLQEHWLLWMQRESCPL
jgi:hypothetical protein